MIVAESDIIGLGCGRRGPGTENSLYPRGHVVASWIHPPHREGLLISGRRQQPLCGDIVLKTQLDECRRAFEASAPPGVVAALQSSLVELVQTGLMRQAVKAGERAPLFRLRSNTGDFVRLSEALDRNPVIVSFFQGSWCLFCRLELQALGQAHPEIERLVRR